MELERNFLKKSSSSSKFEHLRREKTIKSKVQRCAAGRTNKNKRIDKNPATDGRDLIQTTQQLFQETTLFSAEVEIGSATNPLRKSVQTDESRPVSSPL